MRHVPTSLYIDTEFFVRNGLKLDTSEFKILKDTFVKGGLRLLVPEMMERELLRHYKKRARDSAAAVDKAHNTHPISELSLGDLPPRIKLEEKCLTELERQWEVFKEHFTVEQLPLVGDLNDVVNWYFSIEAPFSKKKPKEFPDAFVLSALDDYHERHKASIAVVSADGDFSLACKLRPFIAYYGTLIEYVEAFKPALTSDDFIEEPIDPTVPIVTEDLTELKAILGRGSAPTSIEINRALKLLHSRGENYRYFFLNTTNHIWLDPLHQNGYFRDPPNVVESADGQIQFPFWPELEYLKNLCKDASMEIVSETIRIVLQLPAVDNPRVYSAILDIALALGGEQSVRLKPKMLEYANLEHQFFPFQYPELLAHWTDTCQTDAALEIANILIQFVPDPDAEEKQNRHREIEEDQTSSIEDQVTSMLALPNPAPRFHENYRAILGNGIRPIAEKEPYRVARILIDAAASMIRYEHGQDFLEVGSSRDSSEIWCPRLDRQSRAYHDHRETLVRTLTFACEMVFDKTSEAIETLDNALRNGRWDVFKRVRQHLYSLHPNEQTKPWIQESMIGHGNYATREHQYEFQRMIRLACEHFGDELLSIAERTQIFDKILCGPPEEEFHEWTSEQFTETGFEQRRRYFHRQQLRPFAPVLFGKYEDYFRSLEADETAEEITDESYSSVSFSAEDRVTTFRSPIPPEELARFSDEDLLTYINAWDDEHWDRENGLTQISIEALTASFKQVFKDSIIPNKDRLQFWMNNRDNILRPIYVRAMVDEMRDHVSAKNFDELEQWLGFCVWTLTRPEAESKEGTRRSRFADESRESPSWHSSRRAVCDFVEACVKRDVNVPIVVRGQLGRLLKLLCTQYDSDLDQDSQTILDREDPLTDAINTTRGRALEILVNFGFWLRRHDEKAEVSEMKAIIECRSGTRAEHSLTIPEYAILGRLYGWIFNLEEKWAITQKSTIFPTSDNYAWRAAFGNFLRWSRPYERIFYRFRDDFEFALGQLHSLNEQMGIGRELISKLGQHLFTYYLWGVYPLNGDQSLLERFYLKTEDEHRHWATLFNYVGHSLQNTGHPLEEGLQDKIIAFFEWRIDAREPMELREVAVWLKAECLDVEWRLNALSEILDVDNILDETGTLDEGRVDHRRTSFPFEVTRLMPALIPTHTHLVVECFKKLINAVPTSGRFVIPTDDAKAILTAGLEHEDERVRENARQAREDLLRRGYFSVLD